ncbi:peptide deformylase [Brevundimonas sp.]|uniref:peptide deformylase n=1 Tax=Brevundimonas sp. TaxID=1871086 RepID=UPI0035B2D51A
MSLRRILTVDKPADLQVLKQVCAPVAAIDEDVKTLAADMLETMYDAPGIGLAAIQIGDLRRVVVMDVGDGEPDDASEDAEPARNPMVFVNPEILWASDELSTYEEGCLSIPDYFDEVKRPARVRVAWLDLDGQRQEREADGLFATCIQHEIDHLNGVLFIDHLSRLRRDRAMTKVKKVMRAKEAA